MLAVRARSRVVRHATNQSNWRAAKCSGSNLCSGAGHVAGIFFPQAIRLGCPVEATCSPEVERQVACWERCARPIRWVWQGQVEEVVQELARLVESVDERRRETLRESLTYLTNNAGRMKYPEDRQAGLPITTTLIESTIKQIKGTDERNRKVLATGSRTPAPTLRRPNQRNRSAGHLLAKTPCPSNRLPQIPDQ